MHLTILQKDVRDRINTDNNESQLNDHNVQLQEKIAMLQNQVVELEEVSGIYTVLWYVRMIRLTIEMRSREVGTSQKRCGQTERHARGRVDGSIAQTKFGIHREM